MASGVTLLAPAAGNYTLVASETSLYTITAPSFRYAGPTVAAGSLVLTITAGNATQLALANSPQRAYSASLGAVTVADASLYEVQRGPSLSHYCPLFPALSRFFLTHTLSWWAALFHRFEKY